MRAEGVLQGSQPTAPATRRDWRAVLHRARTRPMQAASICILLIMIFLALGGFLLPLPDAQEQDLLHRLQAPMTRTANGTLHIAGTDQLGRDVLSRVILGARISLGVALATVIISGTLGSLAGMIAGYRGGILDQAVMRLVDLQMAFPTMLLAIFLLYLLGSSLLNLIVLLSLMSWVGYARMARAQTLSVKNQVFVESAQALGCSTPRLLLRHILPHLLPVLLVIAVFDFAGVMLAEAGLSFLGLGVQPPDTSWGRMIADGQSFIFSGGWWLFLIPGVAIFITVLSTRIASTWVQERIGTTTRIEG